MNEVERVMSDHTNDLWDLNEISDDAFYDHLLTELNHAARKESHHPEIRGR